MEQGNHVNGDQAAILPDSGSSSLDTEAPRAFIERLSLSFTNLTATGLGDLLWSLVGIASLGVIYARVRPEMYAHPAVGPTASTG